MDASMVFLQLAIILVAARAASTIAARFGAPSVIGELVAGIILGPSLLGWLEPTELIRLLAEIGIILLLFEVGVDTDLSRLAKSGWRSASVAVGGFFIPFALGFGLSRYVFGQDLILALFIGGTLTATSIGVTVRILRDVSRQDSREGQIVLGAAVIDDVLGVLLLAFLYEFAQTGDLSITNVGRLSLLVGLFFVLAPVLAKVLSAVISRFAANDESTGVVATLVVALVLLFAWAAHASGAPELLGGFAAGLALSRRFFLPFGAALGRDPNFADRVQREMRPIVSLFTPIFFVTVGLSLDLREVDWASAFVWLFSISLAIVAILGKIAGGFLLSKEHWLMKFAVGMAMVPRGEVGLIFAELGRVAGIFDGPTYALSYWSLPIRPCSRLSG
ncbi:cation:proton antiporter [Congregibacter litoralis]|uniref:Transporter, CPA2 family n=1 Tax=Congregibacter litoralis KT71 TaxID=314285 RepID=A4ABT3_9GAMM|nr:cation:proton antiporter [Congregibacter litoralis]EAQ96596.1 transporter, CPA2 family [Congregibacter litoralis KT71]